jgi:hypothetical protein
MSRHQLGIFFATIHIGNLPPWPIQRGERRFLPFAGNNRDHDGKPEGREAHDSGEDEADASQDPRENPRASKNFDAQIREDRTAIRTQCREKALPVARLRS